VPLEFLEYVLDGIIVSVDLEKNTVTVRRTEYTDSTPLEPHYQDVSFQLKADSILTPLDENKYFSEQPIFSFKNDLTEYEKYMNPTDPSAFMVLLNKQNPILDPSYEPETLVYIENEIKNYWIDATVAKALEAMLMEIKAAGFNDIYITSGYRSYNYQSILYDNYINAEMSKNPNLTREEAEKLASTYSAKPGTSEHHTGLCVDITTTAMGGLLEESFADLEIYDWLVANAWKFGFTLRYPSDKVDITGYVFEPWHWRFVGRDAALEMLRTGECFEEYLERTQISE
jgi:LAS superfamily LD-carboxypeptidase LdcB